MLGQRKKRKKNIVNLSTRYIRFFLSFAISKRAKRDSFLSFVISDFDV